MTEVVKNLEAAIDNTIGHYDHQDFRVLNEQVNINFLDNAATLGLKLFKVQLGRTELFDKYLELKHPTVRQGYNCNCCKSFLRRYGDLVTIDPNTGATRSVLWKTQEQSKIVEFDSAFAELAKMVEAAPVAHYFTRNPGFREFGSYEKGGFNHFSIAASNVPTTTLEIGQRIENFKLLKKNVEAFPLETIRDLLAYFTFDKVLKNAEQQLDFLRKFCEVAEKYSEVKNTKFKNNIIWLMVATCNMGVINIGNGALGEFLTSVMKDGNKEPAKSAFLKMIDPLNRMRATAPAKLGTIDAAEKIFEKMDIASALKRRFARLDEIPTKAWVPPTNADTKIAGGGVFASLKALNTAAANLPVVDGGTVSWAVFVRDVLPKAWKIAVKFHEARYMFGSLLTAVDPNSKPIFRYDKPESRNQFSGFFFIHAINGASHGITARECGLTTYKEYEVEAIVGSPDVNFDLALSSDRRLVLRDIRPPLPGSLAIFPSDLIPELYPVRSVIEQYSTTNKIEPSDDSMLAVGVNDKGPIGLTFVVTTDTAKVTYLVDRGE